MDNVRPNKIKNFSEIVKYYKETGKIENLYKIEDISEREIIESIIELSYSKEFGTIDIGIIKNIIAKLRFTFSEQILNEYKNEKVWLKIDAVFN